MEKIAALIDKLQELKAKDAALSDLAYYTQLLYAELMCAKGHVERENRVGRKKVAVIMPGYQAASADAEVATVAEEQETYQPRHEPKREEAGIREHTQPIKPEPEPVAEPEPAKALIAEREPVEDKKSFHAPQTLFNQPDVQVQPRRQEDHIASSGGKELNELIAEREHKPSLNDKLKTEKVELAAKLTGAASINDLSKAIGINDKFLFINELFRGDPDMYDRSIKTINGCNNLESAEYWIERELKIKLGWQEKDNTVQQFYHLIRKRFAAA